MKYLIPILSSLFLAAFFISCSTDSDTAGEVVRNQEGVLVWGFSPAQDGTGMLFKVDDKTYGAPGVRSDYDAYFDEDKNETGIVADFVITGEKTVRGWGAEYPAIEFLSIRVR